MVAQAPGRNEAGWAWWQSVFQEPWNARGLQGLGRSRHPCVSGLGRPAICIQSFAMTRHNASSWLGRGSHFGSLYRPKYNILILISLLNLKLRNQFKKAPRQNNTICPGVCLCCFILPATSSRCHLDEGNTALLWAITGRRVNSHIAGRTGVSWIKESILFIKLDQILWKTLGSHV